MNHYLKEEYCEEHNARYAVAEQDYLLPGTGAR
jgi:hypothetical protein